MYHKLRLLLDSIRFEHTVFALPFAYLGMVLAAEGLPSWHQFIWVTVAMASARTLAMSSNRIIDSNIDAKNPRTKLRHIPDGTIRKSEMTVMAIGSLVMFFVAAYMLNELAFLLAPIAVVVVVGYSYTKRFTWASHLILGFADGIAPAGGWIAVTGTLNWESVLMAFLVTTWIAGFDILYACQDYDFDVENSLHSIPQRFGIDAAFRWSSSLHIVTSLTLLSLGILFELGFIYYIGWFVVSVLLVYEHRLVSPKDLSKLNMAFFNINGYIAVIVFVATLVSIYV
jgi:4-hydroxybenzoate polyprenyltransferase